jgi:hypothetical protein
MVKPGIQTRRRKPKNNNGNGSIGNPNSKSKHNKHGGTSASSKEPTPCASDSTLDYGLGGTRKYSLNRRGEKKMIDLDY